MITSLYQSLCNMETNIADRVALRWYDEKTGSVAVVHYAKYAQDLRRFVAFLRAEYGDVRGKRVAILSPVTPTPRRSGQLAGTVTVPDDFDAPLDARTSARVVEATPRSYIN